MGHMKKLYEFKVQKPVITKVEEKTPEGTLVKDVESNEEKKAFIKFPGRREIDQMRIIQSAEMGKAIGLGVQTHEAMRNAILNNKGFEYAHIDLEEIDKISMDLKKKKDEYLKAVIDESATEILEKEIHELNLKIEEMRRNMEGIFQHSAESIAEREVGLWAVLNLTFWEDGNPIFPGSTDESRKQQYYDAFDDPTHNVAQLQAFSTAYIVLNAYLFKGMSPEDFAEEDFTSEI